MNNWKIFCVGLLSCALFASCSSGVDTPNGSSRGYGSARLIAKQLDRETTSNEATVHRMIHSSIASQFKSHGMAYNQAGSDLLVAYLVVLQDNAMTTYLDEYYGSGEDAQSISDQAHERGVIKGKRRESFERAGLVVDVLDAKTNELIYRNYYVDDIVRGTTDAVRAQRINNAVNSALAPFFK